MFDCTELATGMLELNIVILFLCRYVGGRMCIYLINFHVVLCKYSFTYKILSELFLMLLFFQSKGEMLRSLGNVKTMIPTFLIEKEGTEESLLWTSYLRDFLSMNVLCFRDKKSSQRR